MGEKHIHIYTLACPVLWEPRLPGCEYRHARVECIKDCGPHPKHTWVDPTGGGTALYPCGPSVSGPWKRQGRFFTVSEKCPLKVETVKNGRLETAKKRLREWSRSRNRQRNGDGTGKKTAPEPAKKRQDGTGKETALSFPGPTKGPDLWGPTPCKDHDVGGPKMWS